MPDIIHLLQNGGGHVWLYLPVAVLLGALHGLEPGHSKTMMAAFIIAIRGTVWQAVLLGISAALSHSLIIWLLAGLALFYGNRFTAESMEPYLQIGSAVMIFMLAVWMYFRTRREVREAHLHKHGPEPSDQPGYKMSTPAAGRELPPISFLDESADADPWRTASHSHASTTTPVALRAGEILSAGGLILPPGMRKEHHSEPSVPVTASPAATRPGVMLDTGHGFLNVTIVGENGASRFRIHPCKANGSAVPVPKGTHLGIETARLDGSTRKFQLDAKDGYWESTGEVPHPHEFLAVLTLGHSDHAHTYRIRFKDEADGPGQGPQAVEEIEDDGVEYQDAHERAHAQDIARRFANRSVTTPQIILFGITGGLMPCPAAFTILLVCLQLKRIALGFSIVGAFSFGLALTMVTVGAVAAWSVHHAEKRFSGFGDWMRRAPYISCAMLVCLACYMAWSGWHGLAQLHAH